MIGTFPTDKIRKLIPRLASNHDGEVLGTVAAIRRTLESAGCDLHALAAVVNAPSMIPRLPPGQCPDHKWLAVAQWCGRRGNVLTDRELQFILDLIQYRRRPSEKQLRWLAAIYEKCGGSR